MTPDQVANLTKGDTLYIEAYPGAKYRVPCTYISRGEPGVMLLVERDMSYYWQAAGTRMIRRLEPARNLHTTKEIDQ